MNLTANRKRQIEEYLSKKKFMTPIGILNARGHDLIVVIRRELAYLTYCEQQTSSR